MAKEPIVDNGSGGIGRFPSIILGTDGKLTEQQANWLTAAIQSITDLLNGQASLGTGDHGTRMGNFAGQWLQVYFKDADVEVGIPHGLGRRPTDVLVGLPDKSANFYTTRRGSWSDDLVYLACDTADVTAPIVVF